MSTAEEASQRISRAYRVKFDQEPSKDEEVIIKLGSMRVAEGESFHWSQRGNHRMLNYSSEGQQSEEDIQASDLLAMEAESVNPEPETSRPITAKEMQYCRYRSVGDTQATAYVKAGYNSGSIRSAEACASALEKRPCVQIYLRKLKESSYLANVLSLGEKRDFLASVVRTPVGDIDEKNPLAQSIKFDRETGVMTELKIPDKLKAIELDAKLSGELNEQTQVHNTFNLGLLGSRMDDVVEVESEDVPRHLE